MNRIRVSQSETLTLHSLTPFYSPTHTLAHLSFSLTFTPLVSLLSHSFPTRFHSPTINPPLETKTSGNEETDETYETDETDETNETDETDETDVTDETR